MFVQAEELHLSGSISVKKIFVDGVSLMDFFKEYVDTQIANALKRD